MDAERGLELVKKGGSLVFQDVPQNTLLGIDTQMFSVGPMFKGIKMIPPGPHFIYYSSTSNRLATEFSPVTGFFFHFNPSQVIVRKWDSQEERLVKLSDDNEEERYVPAVQSLEFDKHLGPYTLTQFGEWKMLSNYITKTVIQRIEPVGAEITVIHEPDILGNGPSTAMEVALSEQLKNSTVPTSDDKKLEKKGCYYTKIPRLIKKAGLPGQDLTSLNLDKTSVLESILMKNYNGDEDLQFAFVAFLMGQSLEAFFQWKALVNLLLGCTEAPLHTRSRLFTKFMKVLYYQLRYAFQKEHSDTIVSATGTPTLLDDSFLSVNSFLQHLCKEFFLLVLEAPFVDGDLLAWTRKLKALLEESLGWVFPQENTEDGIIYEEDDEFAPVVVMLDESSYNEFPAS